MMLSLPSTSTTLKKYLRIEEKNENEDEDEG